MKKLTISTVLLSILIVSSISVAKQIRSNVPRKSYYKFIKGENSKLSRSTIADIYHALEYYTPRYFGTKNNITFENALSWMLAVIAQESSFRNINGDEGKSIGYGQIRITTCDEARKYNGIKRKLNLIARWDNLHCSYAEIHRLFNIFENIEYAVMAYNCGEGCVKYWIKKGLIEKKKKNYLNKIKKKRQKLLKIINTYKKRKT